MFFINFSTHSSGKVVASHWTSDAGCQEGDSISVPIRTGVLALGNTFHQSTKSQVGAQHNQQRVEGNQREESESESNAKLPMHNWLSFFITHLRFFFQFFPISVKNSVLPRGHTKPIRSVTFGCRSKASSPTRMST